MEKEHSHFRYLLLLYIILVSITVPLFILTLPLIRSNLEKSSLIEHYRLWKEEKSGREKYYPAALFSGDEIITVDRKCRTIEDEKHSLVEALLQPLSDEEKAKGFVSYIPEGTTLIGISGEDGYFFVEFSSSILESSNMTKAAEQIKKTLECRYTLESLTIISGKTVLRT